jgi:magnesium-transporting ATPase (P-type)
MEQLHEAGSGMEERLWSFIDGSASNEERSVIAKLVESRVEWKTKYQELLDVHTLLQSSELDAPSLRFTKNVMEEIAKLHIAPATRTYINKKIIWGIAWFFIAIITGFLVYGFGQMEWSSGNSSTITDQFAKIDISKFFNNTWVNVFMMINLVLGLFLLDNYLSNKRKQFRKEA